MANGEDAAAAGMAVVSGLAPAELGYDEINLTRDYIARRDLPVYPIARGGTASTTPAAARAALEITPANIRAIENGGANHTTVGWNGTRLEWAVPGYVFPTVLANLADVTALLEAIDALRARVAALEDGRP